MEETTILESNKLIADFMGYYFQTDKFYSRTPGKGNWFKEAKYNQSWDWLMPVAQKILQLPPIKGMAMEQILRMEIVVNGLMAADMCKIYFACIDFIEWYNSSNQLP